MILVSCPNVQRTNTYVVSTLDPLLQIHWKSLPTQNNISFPTVSVWIEILEKKCTPHSEFWIFFWNFNKFEAMSTNVEWCKMKRNVWWKYACNRWVQKMDVSINTSIKFRDKHHTLFELCAFPAYMHVKISLLAA